MLSHEEEQTAEGIDFKRACARPSLTRATPTSRGRSALLHLVKGPLCRKGAGLTPVGCGRSAAPAAWTRPNPWSTPYWLRWSARCSTGRQQPDGCLRQARRGLRHRCFRMSLPPRPAACAPLLEIELTTACPRQFVQRRPCLPGGTVGDALKAAGLASPEHRRPAP